MTSTTSSIRPLNPAWKIRMNREEKDDFDRIDQIMRICDERDDMLDFAAVREAALTLRRNYLTSVGRRIAQESTR